MSLVIAGIDAGSGKMKVLILNEERKVLAQRSMKSKGNFAQLGDQLLEMVLNDAGLNMADLSYVAATGLGRYSIPFRHIQITEITCAARGAKHLFPETLCVLDIGSQSTRAIKLRNDGKVKQFRSNDRCAAGSGGFLERAAKYLQVSVDEIGNLSLHAQKPQPISSVCAVLAESEIINHVSNGASVQDIFRGIHESLADRAVGLIKRVGLEGKVAFVGGVAKQAGMVRALEDKLGASVYVNGEPEFACALGAALLGLQRLQKLRASQTV